MQHNVIFAAPNYSLIKPDLFTRLDFAVIVSETAYMHDGSEKTVIPDASINCQTKSRKGNSFINAPQFVLEVLSPSAAKYDQTEKKEIYRSEEIPEYWIIDIWKRLIEIYDLDYENDIPKYFLIDTVTAENKKDLHLLHFPHIKIDFEQLFDGID